MRNNEICHHISIIIIISLSLSLSLFERRPSLGFVLLVSQGVQDGLQRQLYVFKILPHITDMVFTYKMYNCQLHTGVKYVFVTVNWVKSAVIYDL